APRWSRDWAVSRTRPCVFTGISMSSRDRPLRNGSWSPIAAYSSLARAIPDERARPPVSNWPSTTARRPPGRSTRIHSSMASSGCGSVQSRWRLMTRWKRRGAKGSCSASASSKRTDRPRAAALRRASSIIADAKSTPTTWCPRAASSRARKPVPQPTSSASRPGRPSRTRSKMRFQAVRSPGVRMLWAKSSSKLGARRFQWVATCCLTRSVGSEVMLVRLPSSGSTALLPRAGGVVWPRLEAPRRSLSTRPHLCAPDVNGEHSHEWTDRDVSGRPLFDEIGRSYGAYRRPDPRFAAAILRALGDADSVVNVGAGTGSYEPTDRAVVAVEPSVAMIRQRNPGGAPIVQASATDLPFRGAVFAASLAVLTIHHWPDRWEGLRELKR